MAQKHIRHSLAVPRDRTSSQIAMVLVQTYGISRSHLNHRRQLLRRLHSISWFAQRLSLVRTERNNYKLHVQRQVTQEAMPVGTVRRLDV